MATVLEQLFKETYHPTDQKKCVNNYVIGAVLGQGHSSLVRRAVDRRNGQQVAVKLLAKTAGNQGKQLQRQFRKEAEVLMRVRHPHIVALIELLETSRYLYVVMEMVPGDTLRSLLKDRSFFPEEEVRGMVKQISEALLHLHAAHFIHRDLKPENVMVSGNDHQLKLIDMGLSGVVTGGQTSGQCGSPVYMAPEVLRGQRHGPPVDMWSLGVMTHELLTGHVPFKPERGCAHTLKTMRAVYWQIMRNASGDLCDGMAISLEARDFLRGLLQLEEGERLSTSHAVTHAWLVR